MWELAHAPVKYVFRGAPKDPGTHMQMYINFQRQTNPSPLTWFDPDEEDDTERQEWEAKHEVTINQLVQQELERRSEQEGMSPLWMFTHTMEEAPSAEYRRQLEATRQDRENIEPRLSRTTDGEVKAEITALWLKGRLADHDRPHAVNEGPWAHPLVIVPKKGAEKKQMSWNSTLHLLYSMTVQDRHKPIAGLLTDSNIHSTPYQGRRTGNEVLDPTEDWWINKPVWEWGPAIDRHPSQLEFHMLTEIGVLAVTRRGQLRFAKTTNQLTLNRSLKDCTTLSWVFRTPSGHIIRFQDSGTYLSLIHI